MNENGFGIALGARLLQVCAVMGLVFLTLKAIGVLPWSWLWATVWFWVPVALAVLVLVWSFVVDMVRLLRRRADARKDAARAMEDALR